MPSTPPLYAASVVFIYETLEGARGDAGFSAVGFIASVRSRIRPTHRYYYLVTNEHVVRESDRVAVRINAAVSFLCLEIPKGKFQTDKSLDLAIAALPDNQMTSFVSISEEASVTAENVNKLKIGYGTDVFMVSRIVRQGVRYLHKNIAVLRFGNIALPPMYEEPFYLVEMRSIAGHSGSPVLAYPTPFIFGTPRTKEEDFAPILLGINRGHLQETTEVLRNAGGNLSKHPALRSVTNMAISQVVPAWHIFKMLEGKKFKTQRRKTDAKMEAEAKMVDDEQVRELLTVPKGKKKSFKADGSVEISDMTDEEKALMRAMLAASEKSDTGP
jgi:hypothetical protein